MKLMELYNQIQNPIDDLQVIKKLINAYANSSGDWDGFYSQLVRTTKKQWASEKHYAADRDRFYSMMFNKWKNNIVAMPDSELNVYSQDFTKLREYLKGVPDVSTREETHAIFSGRKNDKELEDAIKKYRWTAFGEHSSWRHVCSHYVTAGKDPYPNVEHRLYLNTEIIDTYKMITYLVEKCDEYHLPYYFKFSPYGDRDDNIVIYSSTGNLTKYVEILQEIKREHPELVDKAKEPPILTGKIDGWIGYGSEPSETPDGKRRSFNEVRSKAIVPVIEELTKKWFDHRSVQITYQGKTGYLGNFAESDLEKIIRKLSAKIAKIDPNFVLSVQASIKSNAKQYGIDPDKFCFDIKTRDKMRTMSAQIATDTPVNGRITLSNGVDIESSKEEKIESINSKENDPIMVQESNSKPVQNENPETLVAKAYKELFDILTEKHNWSDELAIRFIADIAKGKEIRQQSWSGYDRYVEQSSEKTSRKR